MCQLSRRGFLAGTLGLVASSGPLLAACGGGKTSGSSGAAAGSAAPNGGFKVVQFFKSGTFAAGVPQRLPFGLGDTNGVLQSGGPNSVVFHVFDADGKAEVVAPVTVARHTKDLSRPYWPLEVNLPAGTYQARMTYGSKTLEPAFFDVSDPATVTVLHAGQQLPALATPTVADANGVAPICTRQPACPLHDTTLAAGLTAGRPIAFLVATPAYCQTAICGPVLDVLLKHRAADITMLHAEVFTDSTLKTPTEAVVKTGLDYEPCLFLARADGTITERLDVIFDSDDVAGALDRLRKA
jgi:hypothetical protein